MGCYAAFVVLYPSIYFGLLDPNQPPASSVPVLGWSMGIGSYPVAPEVFGAILLTYVITGALVVLFGRRVVCSVFCSAPLMYQGTTLDAMKTFNRTEWPAKKYLGSRMGGLYSVTTGLTQGALVVTSVLSYLDSIGRAAIYIEGTDPSVFLFTFSFSVLWYVMFVTIPYTGNYNCVTMGWCYTGAITQVFQKIGFFKLKVRDRNVCKACTTLDCAKSCPVGLVDMPGHFRSKGEFRSTKCCGVGNCVGACPYGNLYISDVRHWVRDRLGAGRSPAPMTPLPVVAPRGTTSASPVAAAPRAGARSAEP
jgi:polyferredoxin